GDEKRRSERTAEMLGERGLGREGKKEKVAERHMFQGYEKRERGREEDVACWSEESQIYGMRAEGRRHDFMVSPERLITRPPGAGVRGSPGQTRVWKTDLSTGQVAFSCGGNLDDIGQQEKSWGKSYKTRGKTIYCKVLNGSVDRSVTAKLFLLKAWQRSCFGIHGGLVGQWQELWRGNGRSPGSDGCRASSSRRSDFRGCMRTRRVHGYLLWGVRREL
ncbi:unnamed protein product, partial [Pleuronectes platessa]